MAGRRLDRIKIEGFKSIREADIELSALNVLIGANGAGKSNFIGMFRLLNEMIENRLQVYTGQVGASTLFYMGPKVTSEIQVQLTFGANGYEAVWSRSDADTLFFVGEYISSHDRARYPNPWVQALGAGHRETKLFDEARGISGKSVADYVIEGLQSWKVYHFHDTSPNARMKQPGQINDNKLFRPDASNLAAFLYFLQERHPQHFAQITETIRQVAPFFDRFILRPSPLNPNTILLEWRDRSSDDYFNIHALSDGTLRFICLATLLLQPELPSTILIDEPELGLHPYAITLLAGMLRSAAARAQVIVSTQSVPLVNQFEPDDLIVVDREAGQSVFKRLNAEAIEHWLEHYSLGELWEKNILGGRPQHWEAHG